MSDDGIIKRPRLVIVSQGQDVDLLQTVHADRDVPEERVEAILAGREELWPIIPAIRATIAEGFDVKQGHLALTPLAVVGEAPPPRPRKVVFELDRIDTSMKSDRSMGPIPCVAYAPFMKVVRVAWACLGAELRIVPDKATPRLNVRRFAYELVPTEKGVIEAVLWRATWFG